jgi:hypothetical protein
MMKLLSFFLLLAVLFSADAAKFRRLRGDNSVNNKYLGLASEVDETVRQRTRDLMSKQGKKMRMPKMPDAPAPVAEEPALVAEEAPGMSMSMSLSMSM